MGYDVRIEGWLGIPAEKVEEAAKALYDAAGTLGKWNAEAAEAAVCSDLGLEAAVNDGLSDGCFFVRPDFDNGSVGIEGNDDYVRREEEDEWIFEALAPFIDDGALELHGEDGNQWLYRIKGGTFASVHGEVVYGIDAQAPEVLEKIIGLLYSDGKPVCLEGSDAIGTLDAIENIIREAGFGPQAGLSELDRMAAV